VRKRRKSKAKRIDSTKVVAKKNLSPDKQAGLVRHECDEREMMWEIHWSERRAESEKRFQWAQQAYENGFEAALWETILYCETAQLVTPKWTSEALIQHIGKFLDRMPYKTNSGNGRLARFVEANRQIAADCHVYDAVKGRVDGGSLKREAFIATAAELRITPNAVRKAVSRHKARVKSGNYYFSTFLPALFHGVDSVPASTSLASLKTSSPF
jgi:hypothetical protein